MTLALREYMIQIRQSVNVVTRSPEILTCGMQIIDSNNSVLMSRVPSGQPTHCSNQQDFYGNIQVKQVVTDTSFDFLVNVSHLDSVKPHFVHEYAFGVTDVYFDLVKKALSGSETVTTFQIKEDPGSTSPETLVSYHRVMDNYVSNGDMENGQRLCLRFGVHGGGHLIAKNVQNNSTNFISYTKTSTSRDLCYWYDDATPIHCREHNVCSEEPLYSTSRILTSRDFTVTFSGWEDPSPVTGDEKFASGIDTYVVNLYEVKESGTDFLDVGRTPVIPPIEQTSPLNITIPSGLHNPAMYAVVLEVKDVANNVKQARRFFIFDNSSKIFARDDKPVYSTTAAINTEYKWQTNLGKICYSWIDRYYNDKLYHLNLLRPIKQDHHGLISGAYEQTSGILPVTGTENVHGITMFLYTLTRDEQLIVLETDVPNFTSQTLCVSPTLGDGETYRVDIVAKDIMNHTYSESLTTRIDSSEPEIVNLWLEKDGYKRLYIHNSSDLSKMTLTFDVLDIHSGIYSIDWSLGTTYESTDIGQGSLGVQRLNANASCPEGALTCYCPSVGPCLYFNFTLTLNSLIHRNTHIGNHNRRYHFTITATNVARLVYIKHLDVLADDSPPSPGVVIEGPSGTPDIDYTSEESVIVNWAGFIDHESGIKLYRVGLATECLGIAEFLGFNSSIASNNTIIKETTLTSNRLFLQEEGKFFVTVVAYNNAMEPSQPVCSDGIVLDRSAPEVVNLTMQSACIKEAIHCSDGSAWFISANLTKFEMGDADCSSQCMNTSKNDFVSVLPKNITYITLADNTCDISSTPRIIYLPIDLINLKWDIIENDSQVHEAFVGIGSTKGSVANPDLIDYRKSQHKHFYRDRHAGLNNGDEFYVFVRITNSAGLQTTAVIGPVLLDESPPHCPPILVASLRDGYVYIHWNNSQFSDNEQQEVISSFFYRIGRNGSPVSGFKPLLHTKCEDKSCFKLDEAHLHKYDVDKQFEFYITVYAYNNAGYHCTVNTEPFYLPSSFPPGHGLVYEVIPEVRSNITRDYDDVDILLESSELCVAWEGFEHHGTVEYELGVGRNPGADDVVPFHTVRDVGVHCEANTNLQQYSRYYTAIRASSSGGKRIGTSDGFTLVNGSDIATSILQVFDGQGCFEQTGTSTTTLFLTEEFEYIPSGTQFHVGHTYTLISNASISVFSREAHIYHQALINYLFYTAFVPIVRHPSFKVSANDHADVQVSITFASCNVDNDVIIGSRQIFAYWANNDFLKYLSHSDLELRVIQGDKNTEADPVTIAYGKSIGVVANYTFRDIPLRKGRYVVSVRPCIENICFNWINSNGFVLLESRYDRFNIEAFLDKTEDTCLNVKLTISNVTCPSGIDDTHLDDVIIRWGLFLDNMATTQISNWSIYHHSERENDDLTVEHCVEVPVYPHQPLFTCAEVYCLMGPCGHQCVPVTIREDPNLFDKTRLYEVDSDSDVIRDIKNSIYAANIGSKLAWLHKAELDFSSEPVRVGGIILGLEESPVTWYLLKDTKNQSLACDDNPLCVAIVHTNGGFSAFHGVILENEILYYVCAEVAIRTTQYGQIHSAFQTCGDGFVIDRNSPANGDVSIASEKGYITSTRHLLVHWDNFQDFHGYVKMGYPDGISRYEYSIGSNPFGQDVVAKTTIGLSNSVKVNNPSLHPGLTYYATVTAFDHVGHSSTVVSPGVLYDDTPPVRGTLHVGTYLMVENTIESKLNVHWTGFHDDESGIDRIQLGIGSTQSAPDIIDFRDVSGDYATFTSLSDLHDGHKYFVIILVTNRARLPVLSSSESFVVDQSPPSEGSVRDGLLFRTPDVDFQANTTHAGCHWSGFSDPHSGVRYYLVGLGTRPLQDDVRTLSSFGTKTAITWQHIVIPGVNLFCIVKACNGAGLCSSVSSNGFTVDNSPPVPGIVHVGVDGHHSRYWAHEDIIQAQWFGFSDVESGIMSYKVCIRHIASDTCDILPFTNFLLANLITHAISLPQGEALCVVVRADNHLGMSTDSISDSFIVDPIPPVLITSPVLESEEGYTSAKDLYQFDPSILKLSWMFEDSQSPIVKHIVSVKTHHEGHTPIENIHLTNVNEFRIALPNKDWLKQGDAYIATITSCNEAGLCTSANSNSLLIDPTPPHLGGITDPMTWHSVTESGKTVSNMNVTLTGFKDVESGIKMYHIIVGETYSGSELTDGVQSFVPVSSEGVTETVQIGLNTNTRPGQLLIISVWAENHAGLSSAMGKVTVTVVSSNDINMQGELEILRHSCDAHYCNKDCTCAVIGQKCHNVDVISECKYNNQTDSISLHIDIVHGSKNKPASASSACISAHWTTNGSGVENITRFEWSMGQLDMPVGTGIFDPLLDNLWYDVGHQTAFVHCLSGEWYLQHGMSYVVYVRAWTSASEMTVFVSSPVHIDNTPPAARRGRYIIENDNRTCDVDLDFTTTLDSLTTCWANIFVDSQSGIYAYHVSLGTTPGGDDVKTPTDVGLNTSKSWPDLTLSPGTTYYVTVTAINHVGLHTTLVSDGVLVDQERPYAGIVFNTDQFYNSHTQNSRDVGVSFRGIGDRHSAIETFFVALDKSFNISTESLQFKRTGLRNSVKFIDENLTDGQWFVFAVKALDAAGFESETMFSPPAMFDSSPPTAFEIRSVDTLHNETVVAENGTLFWTQKLVKHAKTEVYMLLLVFDDIADGYLAEVSFEDQKNLFSIRANTNDDYEVQVSFASSYLFIDERILTVKIENIVADIKMRLLLNVSENVTRSNQIDDAVIVRQVSPSELVVTINVLDEESGIKAIYVGAGSTRGGFQLHPLVLVSSLSNILLYTKTPHGQVVHVSAIVENHAGDRGHFHSRAITMDHTPPMISNASMTTTFITSGEQIFTKVSITWEVQDAESSSTECSCAIVNFADQTLIDGIEIVPSLKQFQTTHLTLTHGTVILALITCLNDAKLKHFISVGPKRIAFLSPNVDNAKIFFDTSVRTTSGVPVIRPSSPLAFSWGDVDDSFEIKGYAYRILQGDQVTRSWEDTEMRTYVSVEDVSLTDNRLYTVEVTTCNYDGVYSDAINASVLVLEDAPSLTNYPPTVTRSGDSLEIAWDSVFSVRPDLLPTYSVIIGSEKGFADILRRVETTEQRHVFQNTYSGSDVFTIITCTYMTGTSAVVREKLSFS
ncbi:uncharacterized protein LOC110455039 isoform X2 [Mizuhopecten yessoensis]|uniref:uncharacterized protein LOC110455039 isoform X2 n=1 Tax=Mizuhopecten yessoensis TaxID=6573 RepID=UPI000B45E8BC|nr:uncharacterized protein LOC110455039 isoform X2 [Mizuhopecten yessoensis]